MPVSSLRLEGVEFLPLAEGLFASMPDVDTYFSCLAALHKARLKFERILQRQAFSTMEQIGHRGLLQFGSMSPTALVAFLAWRKWFEAGAVMTVFLERYVRTPLNELLAPTPARLPDLRLVQGHDSLGFHIGGESLVVERTEGDHAQEDDWPMPNDAADTLPGA